LIAAEFPGLRLSPSRPDDDHIVIACVGSSVPACSATMYRANQSGRFASASPVRFSRWRGRPTRAASRSQGRGFRRTPAMRDNYGTGAV